jgi:hypothetical protein
LTVAVGGGKKEALLWLFKEPGGRMAAAILPKAENNPSRPTGDKPVRAAFAFPTSTLKGD